MKPLDNKRVLSVFSLVMINVIAVDSIRTLPMAASYGFSIIFLYFAATCLFFIPTALITAELSTAFPEKGGLYSWVKRAFGVRFGFLVVYLQWIYNIVWYPTILTLMAGTCAYLYDPLLVENKIFMVSTVLIIFWGCTLLNCFGMKLSSWVSTFGSLVGTLTPMLLIIGLGAYWLWSGNPSETAFGWENALPKIDNIGQMVFFTGILFSLLGLEMSSVHVLEVKNPAKDYPKALLISTIIISLSLTLASLAIAVVVPEKDLDIVTGIIQAFILFFNELGITQAAPWVAGCVVIGGICAVATWIIGPTKGLFAAASDGLLPERLSQTNRYGVPMTILLLQGCICSILVLVYLMLPTVKSAYWFLSAMAAQLAFIMYAVLFLSAIKLRFCEKSAARPFKIPGGNWGMLIVGGLGFIVSLAVIVLGFIPPSDIDVGNIWQYEFMLIGAELVLISPAICLRNKGVNISQNPSSLTVN